MLGDKKFIARAGNEIFFPRHTTHSLAAKPVKTLWTVVPGGNFEEFFDKTGSLPPGEPNIGAGSSHFRSLRYEGFGRRTCTIK